MKYFAATVLSFIVVLGAIRSFHIHQISAPTPDRAVSKYIAHITKDSPMEGETITVVSVQPPVKVRMSSPYCFVQRGKIQT